MGKEVTVDSDDLGVLLTATAVVKQVESVMNAHKIDPFATRDSARIGQAHDRMSKKWRGALRGDMNPDWDAPISTDALTLLRRFYSQSQDHEGNPTKVIMIERNYMMAQASPPGFTELQRKCMVETGSLFEVVYWGNSGGKENTSIDKAQFALRLTDRGIKVLKDLETTATVVA